MWVMMRVATCVHAFCAVKGDLERARARVILVRPSCSRASRKCVLCVLYELCVLCVCMGVWTCGVGLVANLLVVRSVDDDDVCVCTSIDDILK